MSTTVGIIGLGIMGFPMAGHLSKAGYEIVAFDVTERAQRRAKESGYRVVTSSAEVAAASDVVISMVPDSPDVEAVYLSENGVLAGARRDTLLLDMSTISPVTATAVAEKAAEVGCPMLDAPVSGGEAGAIAASLSIMVGGPVDVFERARPVFEILGNPTHCGPSGAGQTVKACNQIQVAMNFIGLAEALILGAKAGVDPEIVIKVLSGGYAQTRVMDVRGPLMLKGDYKPGFRGRFHYKDLNIIREAARAFGASLPASALAHELFTAMMANGWGELDHSAIVKVIAQMSACELPEKE